MSSVTETQRLPGEDAIDRIVSRIDSLPAGYLQVIDGEHLGRIIFLNRSLTRLGLSGEACAVVAHRSDGYYLSHLDGENPPSLNGTSIGDRTIKLKNGDIVEVQGISMKFHEGMPGTLSSRVRSKE